MSRDIILGLEAREGLKRGVDKLADAVKVTLGPKGRIVFMNNKYTGIHGTKDGVTVAENVKLKDEHEKMGAEAVKQVASKTADLAGDGTTTATVLAQAMVKEGIKNVVAGANPMDLKRGMDKALTQISSELLSIREEVGVDNDKIKHIATISSNNDSFLGKLIAKAYATVGNQGVITPEESKGTSTYIDVVNGLQFDVGYMSPYFSTDVDSMEITYEDVFVIITEDKITDIEEVKGLITYSNTNNTPIMIMCPDMSNDVLSYLVLNKIRNNSKVFAVKCPHYGLKRKETLEDVAVLLGGHVISKEKGYKVSDFNADIMGSAEKCIVTNKALVMVNGHGKEKSIKSHIEKLKETKETKDTLKEKDRFDERISKMSGGVAVLYVGAASEVEMKEKKDRLDDALSATKAAIEEGIVAGGGVALLRASSGEMIKCDNFDENTGVSIVVKACKSPIMQIALNSGVSGDVIIDKIMSNENLSYGYNFKDDVYCDMKESGIIDPLKVVRVALENAVSVAGMIIMTECALVNEQNQDNGLPEFLQP